VLPLALALGLRLWLADPPPRRMPARTGAWVLSALGAWTIARNLPVWPLSVLAP
jgi:hypothetical protein